MEACEETIKGNNMRKNKAVEIMIYTSSEEQEILENNNYILHEPWIRSPMFFYIL